MSTALTFDEQLAALAEAGIHPQKGVSRESLLYNYPESDWQERPWDCLFDLIENSDEIVDLAVKCLEYPDEDRDAYGRILRCLVALCKGSLPLENIRAVADFELETATASFDLDAQTYNWTFSWNGPYCDLAVFARFDALLHARSGNRLYILNDNPRNEGIQVVMLSEEQHRGLAAAGAPLSGFEPTAV